MSRKARPTAASWDSDEDLLQDDILGISAFQSSKEKEESDEELDEDALLGSDNEYEKDPVPVKVEKPLISTTSAIPTQTNYQAHVKVNEHVEEYQLLEVPSDADFAGEDVIEGAEQSELDGFENGAGNLVEVDQSEDFGAGDLGGQHLEGLGSDVYNDYESFQSQEETYEDKTIKGFDESSESEDEEKGRGRFISERSNIISIATTKPKTRTDIPDTLEISEEQQAQIDQFLNERTRRGGRRGYRGGHDRGMRGGRQQVYAGWQDRSNMNSQQQAHHQMTDQHKRAQHHQQQQQQHQHQYQPVVSSMSSTQQREVYPITITGQGSYNASHGQPRNSSQHRADTQQSHYQHHPIQQPPLLPSHPSQPASHQSHLYRHQAPTSQPPQHQPPSHHYSQPSTVNPPPQQLAAPVSTATVQLTPGNVTTTTHQQQGRKILINPHFRGAKLDAAQTPHVPPVISSASAMASTSLLPQTHYPPVHQQTSYVQPHTPDVWQSTAQPQHSYPSSTPPVMHTQTHYNPVTQTYQPAPVLQSLPHQQVQQMTAAPPSQMNQIPSQYSGAPQPIQSLAPPNQPPAVYPPSQPYQSTVPPRPVADQSMMFSQPPPQLPPVPHAPPSHFMSSPPQQPPPQTPQPQQHAPPLLPSHLHPPLQTSIPPPHHNTGAAPPLQSFQSQPQYQVQSVPQHQTQPPSHHQMPPPQHQLHHQQSGTAQKMHPPQNLQRSLINTPATRGGPVYNKLQRKYQRIRSNQIISPKRKRAEIQTQQNKNIKVLTSLPQEKFMSDVNEPPNKIPKVSTHLKTLTQSDDSFDGESKSLREKLELQKRMRAEVIRRKELRRLMQAEQRRKDLQDKLAEQGLTLADISEEQKANFIEGKAAANKQLGTVNRTLQPLLGKRPLQTTPGQNTVAGMKRNAPQQLMGRPVKQIKVGSGQNVSQTQNTVQQHPSNQQNKTEKQQTQAATNVILSEEQKNFYQKQYIPPHQQFQAASTPKKIKRVLPTKNLVQKTQLPQQDESKQPTTQTVTPPKAKEQQQQPSQKTPSLQQQIRPLRGGKSRGPQGRTLSSPQLRMPNPTQGQMLGQQRPVLPGPNQPRPMRMQGPLRPGQPANQPRQQMPGGPRLPPPGGSIRHPSPTGLRHPSQGILRHPGLPGHPRTMRGQSPLMGPPPRQPRTGQEQLRPLYAPGQPRFMPPGGQQRPMMLQGRGGIRGMNIRGRGRGMLGRGAHPLPMAPPSDAPQLTSPQAQSALPQTPEKQEFNKKTKLILKKVVKGSGPQPGTANNTQPAAGGKKVLVRKPGPNQMGGPPQGNPGPPQQKPHILRNPVNRQIRMPGPNMGGGPMGRGHPMGRGLRPMGMGPMNTRHMAAAKEHANAGRQGDGNISKKATMIAVDNLSSSTTERTINQMAKSCGQVESLQLLKSQRKALIRFRAGDQAHIFFKKFHRHMLDLSHINVTVLPAS